MVKKIKNKIMIWSEDWLQRLKEVNSMKKSPRYFAIKKMAEVGNGQGIFLSKCCNAKLTMRSGNGGVEECFVCSCCNHFCDPQECTTGISNNHSIKI